MKCHFLCSRSGIRVNQRGHSCTPKLRILVYLFFFFQAVQHHNCANFILRNHAPEVLNSVVQWGLSQDVCATLFVVLIQDEKALKSKEHKSWHSGNTKNRLKLKLPSLL